MCELSAAKHRAQRIESKLRKIRVIVEKAELNNVSTIAVSMQASTELDRYLPQCCYALLHRCRISATY